MAGRFHFLSDPHFNHGNIMKYCRRTKFMTPEEVALLDSKAEFNVSPASVKRMDDELIDNINKSVAEDDVLFCLGDWCFARRHEYFAKCMEYRNRIRCRTVHYIWGNHDDYELHKLFNSAEFLTKVAINPTTGAYWLGEWEIRGDRDAKFAQHIILCHTPFFSWDGSHKNIWHLYGHCHGGAEAWADKAMPGRRAFEISVDCAYKLLGEYRPFSFEDVAKIMAGRPGWKYFDDRTEKWQKPANPGWQHN